ncbi:MAG: DNA-processing protein DprA [Candidatus Gracilibacteria bacterium]|nr:DNA-processing protein DprA [Candidatus Gracilibacteria bacterium]
MSKYLCYLHYLGFSHKNLFKIFENNREYKIYFENFTYKDLQNLGFNPEKIEKILEKRNSLSLKKIDDLLLNLKVQIITYHDSEYPSGLKNIPNKPFLIYLRGCLRSDFNLISVVGSRKGTKYSEIILEKLIPDLIKSNFGIVSGGAFGVDSLSHKITISNSGYTISVIGTSIEKCYPASNRELYDKIISSGGAILSIFPLGTGGEPYNFPIRNEIIAGISLGTIITEAGENSGTLITAFLALELNKDVFVVPGDITRTTSIGSNNLIKDGLGKLTICIDDILEEYGNIGFGNYSRNSDDIEFEDQIEKNIYDQVYQESSSSSSIAQKLDLDIDIVNMKLSILEIKGLIKLDIGGTYRI